MTRGWQSAVVVAIGLLAGLAAPLETRGAFVINGPFGSNGDVGFVNSPPALSIGFGALGNGSIGQMDGFVNVPGKDLGAGAGASADLSNGAPTGIGFTFAAAQPTASELMLTYRFTNNTGAALAGFQFLYYVDPDIGPNFADETATVAGSTGQKGPSSYQVGDPSLSSMFTNLTNGTLGNVNAMTSPNPGDVSIGLGFLVGSMAIGQSTTIQILLSDDGTKLGGFSITDNDPLFTTDSLTVSGQVVTPLAVPEPSSWALLGLGIGSSMVGLRRRRSSGQA